MSEVELIDLGHVKRPNVWALSACTFHESDIFFGNEQGEIYVYKGHQEHGMKQVRKFGSHNGKVVCMLYIPSYQLLFSGSSDHTIKVWDIGKGELIQTLTNHHNTIVCLEYIGDCLVSGSVDRSFKFFQVDKERMKFGFNPWFKEKRFLDENRTREWITTIWSNRKPKLYPYDIIVGDNEGFLVFLNSVPDVENKDDITGVNFVKRLKLSYGIFKVEVTKMYLIVSFINNIIILFDLEGKIQFQVVRWPETINSCVYNGQFNELIIISDNTLFFYGLDKNKTKKKLKIIKGRVKNTELLELNLLNENKVLIMNSMKFYQYDIKRVVPFKSFEAHQDPVVGLTIFKDHQEISTIGDEKTVFSCSQDSTVCKWITSKYELKLQERVVIKKAKRKDTEIFCYFYLQPNTIITGNNNGYICFYNHSTGKKNWFKPHRNTACSLVVFKYKVKSFFLVSGDFDGMIVLCNLTYFQNLERDPIFEKKKRISQESIISLNYYPVSELIIAGDGSGKIKFINIQMKVMKQLYAHEGSVNDLKVIGNDLFSGSSDTKIKRWNLNSYKLLSVFEFHSSPINLLYNLEGTTKFISSDRGGKLLEWDYAKGEIVRKMIVKTNMEITCLYFDKFDNILYCGSACGNILKLREK